MTRRRTETQDLSELLNGMEIKPYPEASLLEKIQRQYNFNTQAEYQEIVGRMSFFRRGELKMEIRKEWEEWTKDFSQQLIEFIRVALSKYILNRDRNVSFSTDESFKWDGATNFPSRMLLFFTCYQLMRMAQQSII